MAAVITDRAVQRVVGKFFESISEDVKRQRLDAGLTIRELAHAAGVDPSHLLRFEDGEARPSAHVIARLALLLGSDLSAHLYPNTGPVVRDRHQAGIAEAVLAISDPRWARFAELRVTRPARGSIDLGLHHAAQRTIVATEIHSDLRRLEQLVRWGEEKAASLPSWAGWPTLNPTPVISRLLVVRATRMNGSIAGQFRHLLRTAYPADPEDALASLVSGDAWPGPAMLWAVQPRRSERYRITPRL